MSRRFRAPSISGANSKRSVPLSRIPCGRRAQVALERVSASHPSIALSTEAATAARENYSSVTEAYSRGLVTVTELIDAQDAALSSDLAQADAKYTFLIDFVAVLRASGSFDLLLDPASRSAWYDEVDRWFREHSKANTP